METYINIVTHDENHMFEIIEKVSQTRNSLDSSKRSSIETVHIHKSADCILEKIREREIVFVSVETQTDKIRHKLFACLCCWDESCNVCE